MSTKKKPRPVKTDLTQGEALALSLVFYVADWACRRSRATRIDYSGRHEIAAGIGKRLVERGLLREGIESVGYGRGTETRYHITKLGMRTVRALEKRGWTEEWLRENRKAA